MGLKLDLGCGTNKVGGGYLGVDCNPDFKPDIVCDLSRDRPAPLNSVEAIFCSHFFEHLEELSQFVFLGNLVGMCQIGARIVIKVPLNFIDPSHPVILKYSWIRDICEKIDKWMALIEYKVEPITTSSILPHEFGKVFTYEQATAVFEMKNREGLEE